jgi:hypothetical protein
MFSWAQTLCPKQTFNRKPNFCYLVQFQKSNFKILSSHCFSFDRKLVWHEVKVRRRQGWKYRWSIFHFLKYFCWIIVTIFFRNFSFLTYFCWVIIIFFPFKFRSVWRESLPSHSSSPTDASVFCQPDSIPAKPSVGQIKVQITQV